MKQLRLIILLLVTFVAQAAMAQRTIKRTDIFKEIVAQVEKQPLKKKDWKIIEEAILAKDIKKLKKYGTYDIAKVDSTIAIEEKEHYWLAKCMVKHKMKWPLNYMNLGDEMAKGYFPSKLYRSAFYIPTDGEMRYKMLEYVYEKCDSAAIGGKQGAKAFGRFIQGLGQRSPMAAFSMLVMAQAFGQNNIMYKEDFIYSVKALTADYLNTWGGKETVEKFNKLLGDFLAIDSDGGVKMKFNLPAKSAVHDEEYGKAWEKTISLYEKLGQQIKRGYVNDTIIIERAPKFPGGGQDLVQFLATNVQYPRYAAKNYIQGYVIVGFIVERDGSITDVNILRGVDPLLDAEAVRVVSSMPKWEPGIQYGEPLRLKYQVPVAFRLE